MRRTLLAVYALTLVVAVPALAQNKFRMEADGLPPIHFTTCGGIGSITEVIEVRDGNSNTTVKTPGRTSYLNVVCTRPLSLDNTLFEWRKQVEDAQPNMRRSFILTLLDRNNKALKSWKFVKAFPVKWELYQFDAEKNEAAIESLEIAHEGMALSQ